MEGRIVLKDGELLAVPTVTLDVAAEAICFGHSLFETMLVRPYGEDGLFRLEAHLDRMLGSAKRLGWTLGPGVETLSAWVRLAASHFKSQRQGYGRLRLTALWPRADQRPETIVTIVPYDPPELPARVVTTDVRVPWTYVDGVPAPKSGSRVAYSFAERFAAQRGADEALLVDAGGSLAEGAKTNVFAVFGDTLATPAITSGILAGIARQTLIELARAAGVRVEERPVSREEILNGGSLLLTNSLWGVRPAMELDGAPLPGVTGTARSLIEEYERAVRKACT